MSGASEELICEGLQHGGAPRLCAVMVTYDPGDYLKDNIPPLLAQVEKLIIVDNGSSVFHRSLIAQVASLPGVQVLWNGDNIGLSMALNMGIRAAVSQGFEWIMTFDQDSRVALNFVYAMWKGYRCCPYRERVVLAGPHYEIQGARQIDPSQPTIGPYREMKTMMTSGMLINTNLFFRAGMFDDSFFLDYADHEFCLRARGCGFKLIQVPEAVLFHRLGDLTLHHVFGRDVAVSHHSALRRYYNTRERLRTYARHWRREPYWVLADLSGVLVEMIKLALFERDRGAKLHNIARGVWDAFRGKGGRY